MSPTSERAGSWGRSRVLAIMSLVPMGLAVLAVIGTRIRNAGPLLVVIAGMAAAGWGAWWAITERMPRREFGIVGAPVASRWWLQRRGEGTQASLAG